MMEWIGSMAFDDTWATKKRPSQTISTLIVRFMHWAFATGLLCLMLSPSIQMDEFGKKILQVSHPGTYCTRERTKSVIMIREKENNNFFFWVFRALSVWRLGRLERFRRRLKIRDINNIIVSTQNVKMMVRLVEWHTWCWFGQPLQSHIPLRK